MKHTLLFIFLFTNIISAALPNTSGYFRWNPYDQTSSKVMVSSKKSAPAALPTSDPSPTTSLPISVETTLAFDRTSVSAPTATSSLDLSTSETKPLSSKQKKLFTKGLKPYQTHTN
jgi:hypothetical protein